MIFFSLLAAVLAGALNATATPIVVRDSLITLPLTGRFNATGARNIVAHDQARARALKAGSRKVKNDTNVPVTDAVVIYTANVLVGTPPTTYTLLVDTGSSNTWLGASKTYENTSSSVDTGDSVSVQYGSGFFFGEEFLDTVKIGPLAIEKQSIGVASLAFGFPQGVDGILGIGPIDLTAGTVSGVQTVPTVLDNAVAQCLIRDEIIGISFEPASGDGTATDGELTFGGTDQSRFTGRLNFVPITSTSPSSLYVGIDQSITYGNGYNGKPILSSTSGIVDTGTTLILIASDAFGTYTQATGATPDQTTGLLTITNAQFANLQSLYFHIGGTAYELTPNAQIWPRALNTAIGGDAGSIYLIVADAGAPSGSGLDFINGYSFLQRFYHVFDVAGKRAGFATTKYTHATTN